MRREFRLMVAIAHDQERLPRKFLFQPRNERGVIAGADRLPTQIFVDHGRVAGRAPGRHQVGAKFRLPGKMIGGEIDEHEQRRRRRLLRHQSDGLVVEEAVGLDVLGAEIVRVVEMLDAGGGLETARAHERAIGRIERDRFIAAAAQRQRQSALDAAGGDPGDEIGKPAERPRREPGQHIVFGEPARAAIALGQEFARRAVERGEMAAIARRHLDAIDAANVETGLIMDHDDVRPPPGGMAGIQERHVETPGGDGVGFHEAVIDEIRHGVDAGAGKFRQIAVVVIAAPGFVRPGEGISDQGGKARQRAGRRRQAADPKWIEPPQRVHQGNQDQRGADDGPAQIAERS